MHGFNMTAKFCIIAATSAYLCWDQWHPDLRLEALAFGSTDNKVQNNGLAAIVRLPLNSHKPVPVFALL